MHPRTLLGLAVMLVCAAVVAAVSGCGPTGPAAPADGLVGRRFPSVAGKDLNERTVHLPEDYAGAPLIVLVAPSKQAQPDAERYLAPLRSAGDVEFVETPVLASLVTRFMQGFINGKMRDGEPRDLWPRIVPLYKDGAVLAEFFDPPDDRLTTVVVLDAQGVIRYHDAAGYTPETLRAVLAAYRELD